MVPPLEEVFFRSFLYRYIARLDFMAMPEVGLVRVAEIWPEIAALPEFAKEALKDLLTLQAKLVTIDNIQKTVADYFKIKVADMYSKKRTRILARPRQMAMFLARELTDLSYPEIGQAFGHR